MIRISKQIPRDWGARRIVAARGFLLAGFATLPLQAAGTVEVVYTVAPSYVLFGLAIAVALPETVAGIRLLPRPISVAMGAVLTCYLALLLFGDFETVSAQERGGQLRGVVYTAYVIVGMAIAALSATFGRSLTRPAIIAVGIGGAAAALYGIWTWFALRLDLPLADINNAVNSDAFTYGHRSQGPGLLGWERIRATFTEPVGFAGFLIVPILLWFPLLRGCEPRWTRIAAATGLVPMLIALTLTDSSIGAAGLVLGTCSALLVWARATGQVKSSGALALALATSLFLIGSLMLNPGPLSAVTGRTTASLAVTSSDRIAAWTAAGRVWASRPAIGFGPGQAATRLAARPDPTRLPGAPVTLRSAQGIVMSSLVDVGLIGLATWIALFASAIAAGVRGAIIERSAQIAWIIGALIAGVFVSGVNGDRVDLRVWVVLAILVAATTRPVGNKHRQEGHQRAHNSAEGGPNPDAIP